MRYCVVETASVKVLVLSFKDNVNCSEAASHITSPTHASTYANNITNKPLFGPCKISSSSPTILRSGYVTLLRDTRKILIVCSFRCLSSSFVHFFFLFFMVSSFSSFSFTLLAYHTLLFLWYFHFVHCFYKNSGILIHKYDGMKKCSCVYPLLFGLRIEFDIRCYNSPPLCYFQDSVASGRNILYYNCLLVFDSILLFHSIF